MPCRIEDYGLIGDCETAALVGRNGSIDWLCWPAFDSDACFAALLGTDRNGRWLISPAEEVTKSARRYWDNTLILETRFETANGVVALIDFMPPRGKASDIVRLVRGVTGKVKLQMQLVIRFGFGIDIPWVKRTEDGALLAIAGPNMTVLRTPVETRGEDLTTVASFEVSEGETVPFVLTYGPSHLPLPAAINPAQALQDTENFWTEWCSHCTYEGDNRDLVMRSLITLKALTYGPSGGIVAAPTTSLPEKLGGTRNWDYRFCWLRDATFTLLALMNSGYTEEALAWHNWLLRAAAGWPANMQIMYGLWASGACWNGRPTGCWVTKARGRFGSAMPRTPSCSSMSTANWSTRFISGGWQRSSSTKALGHWNARCCSTWRKYGTSRITASGSGAVRASTMSRRK